MDMVTRTDVVVAPAVIHFLKMGATGRNRTRFILVRLDGSFYDKNEYGKATGFAFFQLGAAQRSARQKGACCIVSLDAAGQPVVQALVGA
jgi:hypothetical protein